MNTIDFNNKYEKYLEKGHYGLDVHDEEFINWLDIKFQEFIKIPGFSYAQIKEKYLTGRFYCEGLTREQEKEVEDKITDFYKPIREELKRKRDEYNNGKV